MKTYLRCVMPVTLAVLAACTGNKLGVGNVEREAGPPDGAGDGAGRQCEYQGRLYSGGTTVCIDGCGSFCDGKTGQFVCTLVLCPIDSGASDTSSLDRRLCAKAGTSISTTDIAAFRSYLVGTWTYCSGWFMFGIAHDGIVFEDDNRWYFLRDDGKGGFVRAAGFDTGGTWEILPESLQVNLYNSSGGQNPFHLAFTRDPFAMRMHGFMDNADYIKNGDMPGDGGVGNTGSVDGPTQLDVGNVETDAGDASNNGAAPVGRQTLRGHYSVSFEHWLFRACGGSTATLSIDPDSLSQTKGGDKLSQAEQVVCSERDAGPMCAGGSTQPVTIFAEIVADVSPPGVYGHLGGFCQELTIIEVLSASPTSPSDCGGPLPSIMPQTCP